MRLIDADALLEILNKEKIPYDSDVNYFIMHAPTVDPIKHGHWDNKQIGEDISPFDVPYTIARCSVCRGKVFVLGEDYFVNYPYCPNCGAKMDEVEDAKG